MPVSIATWNINSVRLRLALVEHFLSTSKPDILCLQEIKCQNDQFPGKAFAKLGYEHQLVHGQKGYHGVAILSRLPLTSANSFDFCSVGDCRHVSGVVSAGTEKMRIHNFYVPAGGDEPDIAVNPKFDHKLRYVEAMAAVGATQDKIPAILVGDLNIAPLEHDVWSHRQMLKVVSHTPVETQGLTRAFEDGGWADLVRQNTPEPQKVYTWWSYRAKDWNAAGRGRRLDHIWAAPALAKTLTDVAILRQARGWQQPSDHVPVIATLDVG